MRPSRGLLLLVATIVAALLAACAGAPAPPAPPSAGRAELLETYWQPVDIDGRSVPAQTGTRALHLTLAKEGGRMSGYAGCNSLAGSFVLIGEALRFERIAMTRRACLADAGNELESAFVTALEATAGWRISGDMLELRDASGKLRIRLAARALR